MKPADGAAGDGDEDEWEELSLDDRCERFVADDDGLRRNLVDEGHLDDRVDEDDAEDQEGDRSDLEVARQVVARAEQEPNREHARRESVGGDRVGERVLRELEVSAHRAVLERFAEDQGEHQEDDAHDGGFADAAHRAAPHFVDVEAHTQRDGDREADREDTPGRLGERADDDLA